MKKNKLNILLIVVVIGIWAIVALKATGGFFANEKAETVAENTMMEPNIAPKKIANEKLNLNYPDPFLGTINQPIIKNNNPIIKTDKERPTKTETLKSLNWPTVSYYGSVKNTNKNKMVAILSINNHEKRMLPGEMFQEIKLEKITGDSVLVSWGKNKKYVKR